MIQICAQNNPECVIAAPKTKPDASSKNFSDETKFRGAYYHTIKARKRALTPREVGYSRKHNLDDAPRLEKIIKVCVSAVEIFLPTLVYEEMRYID